MTEAQWLADSDPWDMADFVEASAGYRKMLLYALSCCRRASALSDDPRHWWAIEAAEQFVEGRISPSDLREAFRPVEELREALRIADSSRYGPVYSMTMATLCLDLDDGRIKHAANYVARGLAALGGEMVDRLRAVGDQILPPEPGPILLAEMAAQRGLLRDLFGDPFRPSVFDPAWRTPDVTQLAGAIYEGREFDRMPILGDALEEAGCSDLAILAHCRNPAEHVRGCWVVDSVLGKS